MIKKKYQIITAFFLLVIIITSYFVYAAGTSEIPRQQNTPTGKPQKEVIYCEDQPNIVDCVCEKGTKVKKACNPSIRVGGCSSIASYECMTVLPNGQETPTVPAENCESFTIMRERIKCRLQNKIEESKDTIDLTKKVPEACRTLTNPTACISLYKKVRDMSCYNLQSREKTGCLKRAAGILREKINDLPVEERSQKARDYLILLLYELEERVEKANENGKITTDQASEIIDLIIKIKQDILNNKKRSEILPRLNELKQKWRAINI